MNGKQNEHGKPDYSLITAPISGANDARLDTLRFEIKNGVPCLLWCVSWRGGSSHADGTGAYEPIPESIMANLTPETLWGWMARWKVSVVNLIDRDAFVHSEDILQKCRLFGENAAADMKNT